MGEIIGQPLVELVSEGKPHEKEKKGDTYRVGIPREWVTVKAHSPEEAAQKALNAVSKKAPAQPYDIQIDPDNIHQNVRAEVS